MLLSESSKRHFKQLTHFINAYRLKMTQSSSVSAAARAVAAMNRGKKDLESGPGENENQKGTQPTEK